eukprot:9318704-Karenia_brevis.AAC.1
MIANSDGGEGTQVNTYFFAIDQGHSKFHQVPDAVLLRMDLITHWVWIHKYNLKHVQAWDSSTKWYHHLQFFPLRHLGYVPLSASSSDIQDLQLQVRDAHDRIQALITQAQAQEDC